MFPGAGAGGGVGEPLSVARIATVGIKADVGVSDSLVGGAAGSDVPTGTADGEIRPQGINVVEGTAVAGTETSGRSLISGTAGSPKGTGSSWNAMAFEIVRHSSARVRSTDAVTSTADEAEQRSYTSVHCFLVNS